MRCKKLFSSMPILINMNPVDVHEIKGDFEF